MKVPTHSLKYKNAHEVARSIVLRIKSSIIVSCSDNPAVKDILRVWGILAIELKYYLWTGVRVFLLPVMSECYKCGCRVTDSLLHALVELDIKFVRNRSTASVVNCSVRRGPR